VQGTSRMRRGAIAALEVSARSEERDSAVRETASRSDTEAVLLLVDRGGGACERVVVMKVLARDDRDRGRDRAGRQPGLDVVVRGVQGLCPTIQVSFDRRPASVTTSCPSGSATGGGRGPAHRQPFRRCREGPQVGVGCRPLMPHLSDQWDRRQLANERGGRSRPRVLLQARGESVELSCFAVGARPPGPCRPRRQGLHDQFVEPASHLSRAPGSSSRQVSTWRYRLLERST